MKTKLETFIKRNRRRNAHLYLPGLVDNVDFITCPVSNERLLVIKTTYIIKILEMTVDEYDNLYPGVRGMSPAFLTNIKNGLAVLDEATGMSKYETAQIKARATLRQVDHTGKSGYKRKGEKTRNTHMNKVDELGRNGYRRQANYRLTTVLPNGLTIEQNAHVKQKATLMKNNISGTGGASKASIKALTPIINLLSEHNVIFYFDKQEYCFKDPDTGNHYFWDLTIPSINATIEYQSNAWHADPAMPDNLWDTWKPPRGKTKTAAEVLEYDYNKARILHKHRGFVTYYVWENTYKQDVEDILCLLKTLNMKF